MLGVLKHIWKSLLAKLQAGHQYKLHMQVCVPQVHSSFYCPQNNTVVGKGIFHHKNVQTLISGIYRHVHLCDKETSIL